MRNFKSTTMKISMSMSNRKKKSKRNKRTFWHISKIKSDPVLSHPANERKSTMPSSHSLQAASRTRSGTSKSKARTWWDRSVSQS